MVKPLYVYRPEATVLGKRRTHVDPPPCWRTDGLRTAGLSGDAIGSCDPPQPASNEIAIAEATMYFAYELGTATIPSAVDSIAKSKSKAPERKTMRPPIGRPSSYRRVFRSARSSPFWLRRSERVPKVYTIPGG